MPTAPRNLQEAYSALAAATEMLAGVQGFLAKFSELVGSPLEIPKGSSSDADQNEEATSPPPEMTARVILLLQKAGKPLFPAAMKELYEELGWEYAGKGTLGSAIAGAVAYLFKNARLSRNEKGYFPTGTKLTIEEEVSLL